MPDDNARSQQLKGLAATEFDVAKSMLTTSGFVNPIVSFFRDGEQLGTVFVRGGMNAATGVMSICTGTFGADTIAMTMDSYHRADVSKNATGYPTELLHPSTGKPCSMGAYFEAGNPGDAVGEMLTTTIMHSTQEAHSVSALYHRKSDPCPVCQREWGSDWSCSFCTESGSPRPRPILSFDDVVTFTTNDDGYALEGNGPDAMRESFLDHGPFPYQPGEDARNTTNIVTACICVMRAGLADAVGLPTDLEVEMERLRAQDAVMDSPIRDLVLTILRARYGTENH